MVWSDSYLCLVIMFRRGFGFFLRISVCYWSLGLLKVVEGERARGKKRESDTVGLSRTRHSAQQAGGNMPLSLRWVCNPNRLWHRWQRRSDRRTIAARSQQSCSNRSRDRRNHLGELSLRKWEMVTLGSGNESSKGSAWASGHDAERVGERIEAQRCGASWAWAS